MIQYYSDNACKRSHSNLSSGPETFDRDLRRVGLIIFSCTIVLLVVRCRKAKLVNLQLDMFTGASCHTILSALLSRSLPDNSTSST
jgi:hypothetical protein